MTETDLYEQIARYMNLKHPGVIYHFDLSGLWTPSHKARNLYGRLNSRAWPDMFIARFRNNMDDPPVTDGRTTPAFYMGLFIELKKDGVALYKKDGTLRANPHHEEQAAMLEALRKEGYKAKFAVGYDEAVKLIEDYLL